MNLFFVKTSFNLGYVFSKLSYCELETSINDALIADNCILEIIWRIVLMWSGN